MQQKKFLLFDTRVGLINTGAGLIFTNQYNNKYGNISGINNDYVGENATATGAMDLAGLGGGFAAYFYGDDTGSDLVQNGTFDAPIGGAVIWTNNDADANDGAIPTTSWRSTKLEASLV